MSRGGRPVARAATRPAPRSPRGGRGQVAGLPTVAVVGDELTAAEVVAVRTTPGADGAELGRHGAALARNLDVDLASYLRREKAKGEPGEVVALPLDGDSPRTVLMVGIGDGS